MLISPAYATNAVVGTGTSGGATALTFLIAAAITALLLRVAYKKWRRRRHLKREAFSDQAQDNY